MTPPTEQALLEHAAFVRAIAYSLLRDEHSAEDVTQQTMVAALESPPHDAGKLRPWLGRVARNFAFRKRRDAARRARREAATPVRPAIPTPESVRAKEDARRAVVDAVLALDEPYRATILLRFLEELPPREVSRRMEVPVETVRTRTKRALARLRGALSDEHPRDWRAGLALLTVRPTVGVVLMTSQAKWIAALIVLALLAGFGIWSRERPESERRVAKPDTGQRASNGAATLDDTSEDRGPPAPPGRLDGMVIGPDGPVADAFVALIGNGKKVARRTTDAHGRFTFGRPGTYTVRAAHPHYLPAHASVEIVDGERRSVELRVESAPIVPIRVRDKRDGTPLDDVEVLVIRAGDATNAALESVLAEHGLWHLLPRLSVYDSLMEAFSSLGGEEVVFVPPIRTANGRAKLRGILPGRTLQAVLTRDGYAPFLVTRSADGAIDVELSPAATLVVVGPKPGMMCEVNRPGTLLPTPMARARFDEDGRATFSNLTPGLYEVIVSRTGTWRLDAKAPGPDTEGSVSIGRQGADVVTQKRVEVAADQTKTLDLSSDARGKIEGRIEFGHDVRGWSIRLVQAGRDAASMQAAGPGFVFESVTPGVYRVIASQLDGGARLVADVELRAGAGTATVVLTGRPAGVRGLVRDAQGAPISNAVIVALTRTRARELAKRDPTEASEVLALMAQAFPNQEDGTFQRNLAAGEYVIFAAHGGAADFREVTVRANEVAEIELSFAPARVHSFDVELQHDGNEAVRGHIFVRGYFGGALLTYMLDPSGMAPDAQPRPRVRYRLPAGRYWIDVAVKGRAPIFDLPVHTLGPKTLKLPVARGVSAALTLKQDGRAMRNVDLELHTHSGRIVVPSALPSALFARSHGWKTNDAGAITFPHLLPGTYRIARAGKPIATFRVGRESVERTIEVTR